VEDLFLRISGRAIEVKLDSCGDVLRVINAASGEMHSEEQRIERVRIFEERPREMKPASSLPSRMFTLFDYENMMHSCSLLWLKKTELP
jgi:hypothetical protein